MVSVVNRLRSLNSGGIQSFVVNMNKNSNKLVNYSYLVKTERNTFFEKEIINNHSDIYYLQTQFSTVGRSKKELLLNIYKYLSTNEIDIYHIHFCSPIGMLLECIIARMANIEVIVAHSHNALQNISKEKYSVGKQLLNSFARLLIPFFASYCCACSYKAAMWMYPKWYVKRNSVKIIPNGIDIERFAYSDSARRKIRNELAIDNFFVVGNIGRLSEAKNHIFLLHIFLKVLEVKTDSVLLIVGNGSYRDKILQTASALGISKSVMLIEPREDIEFLYSAMDVFVLPSKYEGLPLVLIEAQANSLKCIASAEAVSTEAVVSEYIELLSLEESHSTWADHILLWHHGYNRETQAKSVYESGYDIKDVAKMMSDWYNKIYDQRRSIRRKKYNNARNQII
ncbi:glycosyl transferase family 1 [Clostridia bacterium]|nr:glycosyl transferase family 1 [Clostridia bacterium]